MAGDGGKRGGGAEGAADGAKRARPAPPAEAEAEQWCAELTAGLPAVLDLRDAALHRRARDIADALHARAAGDSAALVAVERVWRHAAAQSPVALLAAQLAVSKARAAEAAGAQVTVVLAVFNEHNRLRPAGAGNPNGEDFLAQKAAQLQWLLPGRWELLIVDDGCPHDSGDLCAAAAKDLPGGAGDRVRVVRLKDHVGKAAAPPVVAALDSVDGSKKGGSIALGLHLAAALPKGDQHVVAYTDADLSADLGLLGLHLHELQGGAAAAIGARFGHRADGSCWCTDAGAHTLGDHDRMFLTARHFFRSRLLPPLSPIIDTQCGLKAFRASYLPDAVRRMTDAGSTFDMELMLLVALDGKQSRPLSVVPIVWCDSTAESNFIRTNDSQFKMLKKLVGIQRQYADRLQLAAEQRAYGRFLSSLTREQYDRLMDRIEAYLAIRLDFNLLATDLTVGDLVHLAKPALSTTVIGSWPKPKWLFASTPVSAQHSRGAAASLWAAEGAELKQLQEKATEMAVREMADAGLDVVSDGEMRRENYVFYHLEHITGVDFSVLTDKVYRGGTQHKELPTITQRIQSRDKGYMVRDYLRTVELAGGRPVKVTLPGPMTIWDTTANSFYATEEELALDLAETLRVEIEALAEAGCTEIQVDEPVLVRYPQLLPTWGIRALNRCFEGVHGAFFTVHICCGYATGTTADGKEKKAPGRHYNEVAPHMARCLAHSISLEHTYKPLDLPSIAELLGPRKVVTLGLVSSCRDDIESEDDIAGRLGDAMKYFGRDRIACCADCGMVMCSDGSARGKMRHLTAAAARVRATLACLTAQPSPA